MGRVNMKTDKVYPVDYMFKKVDEMKQIIDNDVIEINGKIDGHTTQLVDHTTKLDQKAQQTNVNNLQSQVNSLVLGAVGAGNNAEVIQNRVDLVGRTYTTTKEKSDNLERVIKTGKKNVSLFDLVNNSSDNSGVVSGTTSANRLSTSSLYPFEVGEKINITLKAGYVLTLYGFNSSSQFVLMTTYTAVADLKLELNAAYPYYRFKILRTDNANITPQDGINNVIMEVTPITVLDNIGKQTIINAAIETASYYISQSNGTKVSDSRYSISGKYYVQPNDIVTVDNVQAGTGVSVVAYYKDDDTFVNSLVTGLGTGLYNNTSITISDYGYIICTFHKPENIGAEHITITQSPNKARQNINNINADLIAAQNDISELINGSPSEIYGKTINFIGDSYVFNNSDPISYTWHYKFAQKYGMTYNNYGINGNGLVDPSRNGIPVVSRYNDMAAAADYIVIIGGKNDYNGQYPIADFETGLDTLCSGLVNKYVGKSICFFTPWTIATKPSSDPNPIKLTDYVDSIKKICGYYSIPVFDASREGGMQMFSTAFRTLYSQAPTDSSHLNNAGHDLFLPRGEKFLLTV